MNPYDELISQRVRVAQNYTARTLNATTFRMFKRGQSEEIRKFLIRELSDGHRLAKCRSATQYTKCVTKVIEHFRRRFRLSKTGRKPNFGQAAKVINLYVKHLLMLPDYLVRFDRHQLERYAHVPLDRQILGRMWGSKRSVDGDFRRELREAGIYHRPMLKKLDRRDYERIQSVLAAAVRRSKIPAIAYDYLYALRDD